MIRSVIFDMFQTLAIGKPDPESEIAARFNIKDRYFVERFTCGTKYSDRDHYLRSICSGIGVEISHENLKIIDNILKKHLNKVTLDPEAKDVLYKIRGKNLKLAMISDMPNPDWDIIKKEGLHKIFDVRILSYEVGLAKPDPKMFSMCLKRLNIKPEEAIFIGDSVMNDIVPAKKLGMNTILMDRDNVHLKEPRRVLNLRELFKFI